MVDTTVADDTLNNLDSAEASWGPYWINTTTAVIVYIDEVTKDFKFKRTTNGGAVWSAATEIRASNVEHAAAWFDKETPGDTGDILHLAYMESDTDDVFYRSIDISDASMTTEQTIDATNTVSTTVSQNRIAITKARNGQMLVAYSTQANEVENYKAASPYETADWTHITNDVFESGTPNDYVLLFPANVDDGDCAAIHFDRSAEILSVKMYDDSAGTWTETNILTGLDNDAIHSMYDAAVRHSDGLILGAIWNDNDAATADFVTWSVNPDSIASPTIKTDQTDNVILTDTNESSQAAVMINQQNDTVYVAYLIGGTWQATVDCAYKSNTNFETGSWSSQNAYSEAAADDLRRVTAGRTVGDDGGFFQPMFYDDDDSTLFVNLVNDVAIAAVVSGSEISALGAAVVTLTGASDSVSEISVTGLAVVTMTAISDAASAFSADGVATLVMVGASESASEFSAVGTGVMTVVGASESTSELSADGVATLTMVGSSESASEFSADGVATLTMVGASESASQISAAGLAVMTMTGASDSTSEFSATGAGVLTMAGPGGATFKAALNTDLTDTDVTADVNCRVRFQIKLTGAEATTPAFKFQHQKNAGGYSDTTAVSSNVKTNDSAFFTDGDDCDEKLLGGADTLISNNNAAEDLTGGWSMPVNFTVGDIVETELSFTLISDDLSDGDAIDIRVVEGDGTIFNSYTEEASIAVIKAAAELSADGLATAVFTGASDSVSEISAAGLAVMTMTGASESEAEISAAGAATVTMTGASESAAEISAAGAAVMTMTGASESASEISAIGTATLIMVGEAVAGTQAALSALGVATMVMTGASESEAVFTMTGTGTVTFSSSVEEEEEEEEVPSVPGDGGAWGHRSSLLKRKQRRRAKREDEELIAIIQHMAPDVLKHHRILH